MASKMPKDMELQLKSAVPSLPTHLAFWCEAGLCSCPRSWGPLLTSDSGQSPGLSPVALDGFQYITNQQSPHAISSLLGSAGLLVSLIPLLAGDLTDNFFLNFETHSQKCTETLTVIHILGVAGPSEVILDHRVTDLDPAQL